MKLSIWHNIMWARYKAAVFTALYEQARAAGIETAIHQIAETDNDRVALSPVDTSWHAYPYILLFMGAYSKIPRLTLCKELAKRAWHEDADLAILTGYERPEVWIQAAILMLRRKKFAWFCDSTTYDNPQTALKGIAKHVLFRIADGIFCYGQRSSEYAQFYGARKDKIFIRKQAAALPKDYTREHVLDRRTESAPRSNNPRYLYVGRLSSEKSVDRLLHAFLRVIERYPTATLAIVGQGPEESALKEQANQLGIGSFIDFTGAKFDDALIEEYLRATCLVLPSHSEPWGLVVNESLSYGCPVIVSNRCGCAPELAVDGQTGYIFDWNSLDDLAEKLVRAPTQFQETTKTALACLDRVAPFNPTVAAEGILKGALLICTRTQTNHFVRRSSL